MSGRSGGNVSAHLQSKMRSIDNSFHPSGMLTSVDDEAAADIIA